MTAVREDVQALQAQPKGLHPRVNVEALIDYAEERSSELRHRVRIHLEIPFADATVWQSVKDALDQGNFTYARETIIEAAPKNGTQQEIAIAEATIRAALNR